MRLIECVPNFSEGRDERVISEIVQSIEATHDVHILNVDTNQSANRTVVTFVGSPDNVLQSALNMMQTAARLIDMSTHKGQHPRIGATDVCPLVPLIGVSMQECMDLSHRLADSVGNKLEIPVYMYARSASTPERENLSFIRHGQYEALPRRMKEEGFLPDYGPCEFKPRCGATAIGARSLLVAFNINLDCSTAIAAQIASTVREHQNGAGSEYKGSTTSTVSASSASSMKSAGLKCCRAIGWHIAEYGCSQVSMNLLNYTVTPMHTAFEAVSLEAQHLGARVTGSELVGLVPLEVILESGKFYARRSNKDSSTYDVASNADQIKREILEYAISSMGLNKCKSFMPDQKILDYCIQNKLGVRTKIIYQE